MKTLLAALLFVFSTSAMAQPSPAVGGDGYQAWVVVKDEIYWCHWTPRL